MSIDRKANKSLHNDIENSQNEKTPSDRVFLNSYDIETLLQKLREHNYNGALERNNLLFDLIKLKQPISKYALAKLSGISYGTIKQVAKWFEASELIYVYNSISENKIPVKLISTSKPIGVKDE